MAASQYHNVASEDVMPVSIRGQPVSINIHRVHNFPGTRLYDLAESWKSRVKLSGDTRPEYIDRNPLMLHAILDYYVTGEFHLPEALCSSQVQEELEYWGVGPESIAPCCLWKNRSVRDTQKKLLEIMEATDDIEEMKKGAKTCKEKVWIAIFQPFSSKPAFALYVTLCVVYMAFLLNLVLQSLPWIRRPDPSINVTADPEPLLEFYRRTDLPSWLVVTDFIFLALLSLYLIIWFIVCTDKKRHVTVVTLVSGLGLLCQWIPVALVTFYNPVPEWFHQNRFLHSMKVLRILPMFGLLSSIKSMRILVRALMDSRRELCLLLVLVAMSSAFFGYLVFVFEMSHHDTHFRSIPDGLWWGVVTLTTVGYGDLFPQTPAGRMVGFLCAVAGLIILALPVPIISGNFNKIYDLVEVARYHELLQKQSLSRSLAAEHQERTRCHSNSIELG